MFVNQCYGNMVCTCGMASAFEYILVCGGLVTLSSFVSARVTHSGFAAAMLASTLKHRYNKHVACFAGNRFTPASLSKFLLNAQGRQRQQQKSTIIISL